MYTKFYISPQKMKHSTPKTLDPDNIPEELKDPRLRRAGIIPCIKFNRTTFFLLGTSEIHAYISDFGGTRESTDLDILETALREYHEETFGCLPNLSRENLRDTTYITGFTGYHVDERCVLFFVPFPKNTALFSKMSDFRHRSMPGDEIKGLVILNKRQLQTALICSEERIEGTRIFFFHPKVKAVLKSEMRTLLSI